MHNTNPVSKWLVSLALFAAAILAVTPFIDQRAELEYEKLFQRALVTFALARTINGVISVVQGTELALQPAGVGVTLTPGEILDPINDLVERFSWIMFGATVSLGVQNVLLDVSSWWLTQALVALLTAWLLIRLWRPAEGRKFSSVLLRRIFVLVIFFRFAAPGMLIVNDLLYQQFLEPRYQQSKLVMTEAGEELRQLGSEVDADIPESADSGLVDSIARAWSNTTESLDVPGKLQRMQDRAADLTKHLVQLSVVFILQTGLLPVAFLWLLLQLLRWLFKPPSRERGDGQPIS